MAKKKLVDIDSLSFEDLQKLLDERKDAQVAALKDSLVEARQAVRQIESQLELLTGRTVVRAKAPSDGTRAPRGQLKATVLATLSKGKTSVEDLMKVTGTSRANLGQCLNNLKKSGEANNPERGIWSLVVKK